MTFWQPYLQSLYVNPSDFFKLLECTFEPVDIYMYKLLPDNIVFCELIIAYGMQLRVRNGLNTI